MRLPMFLLLALGLSFAAAGPVAHTSIVGETEEHCTTSRGQKGKCTPYYLCEGNVSDDTGALFDFDLPGSTCTESIEICCKVPEKTSSEKVKQSASKTERITAGPTASATVDNHDASTIKSTTEKVQYCTTLNGQKGECVAYYLCNSQVSDDTHASADLDIREENSTCENYLQVCCRESDKIDIKLVKRSATDTKHAPAGPTTSASVVNHDASAIKSSTKYANDDFDAIVEQIFGERPNQIPSHHIEVPAVTSTSSGVSPTSNEIDHLIESIFAEDPNQSPSHHTEIPAVTPTTSGVSPTSEVQYCTTSDGQKGECVAYYLCKSNVSDDTYGHIDSHVSEENAACENYLQVCCKESDKTDIKPAKRSVTEPERTGCGWRRPEGVDEQNTEVTDGQTKFGEYPWMVAILHVIPVYDDKPEGPKLNIYTSGGTLIHPSVVLTAAHSLEKLKQIKVRAGEWDASELREIFPHQDRDVDSIVLHKDYNKGNSFYDIALIFLAKPMNLAPNVGVACLPPPRQRTLGGTHCFTTSWAKDAPAKKRRYTSVLSKMEMPVVERNTCQEQLRKTRLGDLFQLHSSFMCAGLESVNGTCLGDGGSPLVCPIENETERYMQSGVLSWSIGCGEGSPRVFVDVSNLREWIDDKVVGRGYDIKTYTY